MAVTVYADVLFALNYLIDFILLIVTVQFSRAMTCPLRISVAAALLALYGTLVFIPSLKMLYSVLGRIAVGVLAIYLLRLPGGLRGMIKGMVIFFMASFVCGGAVFALVMGSRLGQMLHAVSVNGSIYIPVSLGTLIPAILLAYTGLLVFRRITVRNFSRDRILVPFSLSVNGHSVSFTALLDTGCELTAPLSGEGVLLLSREVFWGISIPQTFDLTMHTAGGVSKIAAFYPEEIRCLSEEYELAETPLIGICKQRFAADDLYQGVFHPKILQSAKGAQSTQTTPTAKTTIQADGGR